MEQIKIDRINELARKSKIEPLTVEEKEEQGILRKEFLADFRMSFTGTLSTIKVQEPDGTIRPLRHK